MAVAAEHTLNSFLVEQVHQSSDTLEFIQAIIGQQLASLGEKLLYLKENFERLPQRITNILGNKEKGRIYQFSIPLFVQRWSEFVKTSANEVEAREKLKRLIASELLSFIKEYVLHVNTDTFDLYLSSLGGNNILSDEYAIALLPMTDNAIDRFKEEGKAGSRMEADRAATSKLIQWAKHVNDGDMAINISPTGPDYLGSDGYAFVFIRILRVLPDGKRKIETIQQKVWIDNIYFGELLRKIHARIPEGFIPTELNLARTFAPLETPISPQEIINILRAFPQRGMPEKYQEILLQNPHEFQQEYNNVEKFFIQTMDQYFPQYLAATTTQAKQNTLYAMEDAFNMSYRRLLFAASLSKDGKSLPSGTDTLASIFQQYVGHQYFGKKLQESELSALNGAAIGAFGSVGRFFSIGQCLGGSIPGLFEGGQFIAKTQLYKGIPTHMLAGEAVRSHFEKCPVCNKVRKVLEMANGDQVCSGCNTLKICGTEHSHQETHEQKPYSNHGIERAINQRKTKPLVTPYTPESYAKRLHREINAAGSTGDAVTSLFTSAILGVF